MKISAEHVEAIRSAIAPFDTEERRANYRAGAFPRSELVKDLNKRYRWDLFWTTGSHVRSPLYTGDYNDAHIDTALRSIVPPL